MSSSYSLNHDKYTQAEKEKWDSLVKNLTVTTTVPSFPIIKHEDFDAMLAELYDFSDNWTPLYEDGPLALYIKSKGDGSTGFKRHKFRGYMKGVTALEFYSTMRDYSRRQEWDQRDMYREIIEIVDVENHPLNVIEKFAKKGSFLVAHRDFVTINAERFELKDGRIRFVMVGKPVPNHPKGEPFPKCVRATIHFNGMVIEQAPDDENSCIFWNMSQVDPAGWIPESVYNWVTRFLPKEFKDLMYVGCQTRKKKNLGSLDFHIFYQRKEEIQNMAKTLESIGKK